ncbi:MAG: HPF/RaiA family ribosome-associated protein [Polyangiales bacterium]
MKLVIRFRDVAPTPALLDHVKYSVARSICPSDQEISSLRVSLFGERHEGEEWFRCRIEIGLRGGALRFLEAGSNDVLLAIDAASDRLEMVQERLPRAA